MMESFWGIMQIEPPDRKTRKSKKEIANAIFEWIECWHNPKRRHSSPGMLSPAGDGTHLRRRPLVQAGAGPPGGVGATPEIGRLPEPVAGGQQALVAGSVPSAGFVDGHVDADVAGQRVRDIADAARVAQDRRRLPRGEIGADGQPDPVESQLFV